MIRQFSGSIQIASTVIAKVQDQFLHPQVIEFLYSINEFLMCAPGEFTDLYESDVIGEHVSDVDTGNGDPVAGNLKIKGFFNAPADNAYIYTCPLFPLQHLYNVSGHHVNPGDQ